jgi:hypothetical protein
MHTFIWMYQEHFLSKDKYARYGIPFYWDQFTVFSFVASGKYTVSNNLLYWNCMLLTALFYAGDYTIYTVFYFPVNSTLLIFTEFYIMQHTIHTILCFTKNRTLLYAILRTLTRNRYNRSVSCIGCEL